MICHRKLNKAFTLVELLVVISIIGMLAAVVLVALSSARNKGKNARIQEEVHQMRNQLELGWNGTNYALYSDFGGTTGFPVADALSITGSLDTITKDIQAVSGATLGVGGTSYSGGTGTPCSPSTVIANQSYCVDKNYVGCSASNNAVTIFTNNPSTVCATPNLASKYAIYAAYAPAGTGGYFCMDSSGKNISNITAVGIPATPGANTTCQ